MKLREVVVFPVVLVAALGVSALLFLPRLGPEASSPPLASVSAPPAPPPPPAVSASAKPAPAPLPAYVRVDPASGAACPSGMVLVDGVYCPFVGHRCLAYREGVHDVCERYGPEVLCEGQLERRRFCIDVYEYPNLEGVAPAVMVDWDEARRACAVEGKRLCTVEEWEFACEGPGMWPYPYGAERDAEACNIDQSIEPPDLGALAEPVRVADEVVRLDRRATSGARPRCVSPFGVRDMTGNVNEWVDNPQGKRHEAPYRSAQKGGAWGPDRARCRAITTSHEARDTSYQLGFRCCADAGGGPALPLPKGVRRSRLGRMELPDRPPGGAGAGKQTP